jgi:hypothetical protein
VQIPAIMFPDRCNLRPIKSAGNAPGAEARHVPDDPVLAVPCFVQDRSEKEAMAASIQGAQVMTQVYFRDEDPTRETIRSLPAKSVIEITHRGGVTLPRPINAIVDRPELDALNGLAIWRVDSITRV